MKINSLAVAIGLSIFSGAYFVLLQFWLGNLHIVTTNGLWKSIDLKDYIENPGWDRIPTSNAILYPIHWLFGALYDSVGFVPPERWRQMAITNAIFGAISVGFCYFYSVKWSRNYFIALLACIAYCFGGFFLLHSVTNEDIMPAATFCLISFFLAADWFARPSLKQVALVSIVLSLGWLTEWRVMFPALPPMLLALIMSEGRPIEKITRVLTFITVIVAAAFLFSGLSWVHGERTLNQAFEYSATILWTGKGVGSGWGGFTVEKLWLLIAGMSEAVLSGRYIMNPHWLWGSGDLKTIGGVAILTAMMFAAFGYLLKNPRNRSVQNRVILYVGLVVAGGVFNAYSQPSDPQMQQNVMFGALPAWLLLFSRALSIATRYVSAARLLALAVALVPAALSLQEMWKHQGLDVTKRTYINEMSASLDMTRTVFLYHDFDGTITWWVASYDGRLPFGENATKAPTSQPYFKWIGYVRNVVERPSWSGEQVGQSLIEQIDNVMNLGFMVVAPESFNLDDDAWALSYATVASREKSLAIRKKLHSTYETIPLLSAKHGEDILEIRRRR